MCGDDYPYYSGQMFPVKGLFMFFCGISVYKASSIKTWFGGIGGFGVEELEWSLHINVHGLEWDVQYTPIGVMVRCLQTIHCICEAGALYIIHPVTPLINH